MCVGAMKMYVKKRRKEKQPVAWIIFFCTFVTDIDTVHFLTSPLFPVNCAYLYLWSSPFMPPILNSILAQQGGVEEGGWRGNSLGFGRALVGTLNWAVPFPNQDSPHWWLKCGRKGGNNKSQSWWMIYLLWASVVWGMQHWPQCCLACSRGCGA